MVLRFDMLLVAGGSQSSRSRTAGEVLDIEVKYVELSSCRGHDEGVGGRW